MFLRKTSKLRLEVSLDERAELLAALDAYPVKDGTQAVLALIEDARKK